MTGHVSAIILAKDEQAFLDALRVHGMDPVMRVVLEMDSAWAAAIMHNVYPQYMCHTAGDPEADHITYEGGRTYKQFFRAVALRAYNVVGMFVDRGHDPVPAFEFCMHEIVSDVHGPVDPPDTYGPMVVVLMYHARTHAPKAYSIIRACLPQKILVLADGPPGRPDSGCMLPPTGNRDEWFGKAWSLYEASRLGCILAGRGGRLGADCDAHVRAFEHFFGVYQ